jgi:CheY-like chemotaxis protein
MFERIQGLPAEGDGIQGLELTFRAGVDPTPAFHAKAVNHFRAMRDLFGQPMPYLKGLGDEVEQLHAAYTLLNGSPGGRAEGALFAAALAAGLLRRLGGREPVFTHEVAEDRHRISFEPGGDFLHSFCLLYSVSFLHYYWLEGSVEPRLTQLLEVADLFFLTDAGPLDGPMGLAELENQFPQEVLNSFVNLIHPHPKHLGNLLTKILLLEDNRELGEIIADMLSSVGYVVCQAPDGISGLSRLERERFRLILSDIQMPRLNGMGLLKALRDLHLEIPVILTTGFTGLWQEEQALQQGAVAFLPKPFGMTDLIQTVERALAGHPAHHPG